MIRKLTLLTFLFFIPIFSFTQIDHWETVVYNTDEWQYFIGNSEPPSNWALPTFDDTNWLKGKGGFGYGDEDDETIIPTTFALYLRHSFSIIDKAAIETLILQADYDDAFVAYLNGVEITRANIEGNPPMFNTETITDHEATLYSNNTVESTFFDRTLIEALLVEGENVLAISVHNRFGSESSDMTANFFLTVGINNDANNYRFPPEWFITPSFFESTLPVIKINTTIAVNSILPTIGNMEIVQNRMGKNSFFDPANEYKGKIKIKHRGESSLSFLKKSFSIETLDDWERDLDVSFLNFPEEEDWILNGPYSDKTLMRNVLIMDLARKMGQYASRTQYVDLFVNGDYRGIYVLMEKIKRDKDRVDISKLKDSDLTGDELTGGYIFKIDKGPPDWISKYDFLANPGKLIYQLVYPDIEDVAPEQFKYIRSYVDSFENAMADENLVYGGKSFEDYIDLNSFAEAHILNEIGRNIDAYRFSSYFYKRKDSKGGKIVAGPIWDFNLAFRNADYCEAEATEGLIFRGPCAGGLPFWWDVLLKNETFQSITRCRWEALRETSFHNDAILGFIDEQATLLRPSIDPNFDRWEVLGNYLWPNPLPIANTYTEEISLLKEWLIARLAWLDDNIGGTCQMSVSTTELEKNAPFEVFPNPAVNQISILMDEELVSKVDRIAMINTLGQRITLATTTNNLTFDISHLITGIYFIEIQIENNVYLKKVIIK